MRLDLRDPGSTIVAHGDRARIQPADHARSLFRVELLFSRSSTRGVRESVERCTFAPLHHFHRVPILLTCSLFFFFLIRLFLFFLLPPLLFPHVISRFYYDFIIEGRKKIRGGIDSRKELERKNIGARMLYLLALSRCYAIPGLR